MAVPKRRHSHARKGNRASHQGLKRSAGSFCSHCSAASQPHRICPNCGHYAGRDVLRQGK